MCLLQVGEYVPSIASGELAVSNAPLWWCGYQTLGRALLGVGELHRAVLCFSRALRLRPGMGELREDDLQVGSGNASYIYRPDPSVYDVPNVVLIDQ